MSLKLQAEKEPPSMMRHRLMLPKWGPVINSLEQLITNAAALEALLEGGTSAQHPQLC